MAIAPASTIALISFAAWLTLRTVEAAFFAPRAAFFTTVVERFTTFVAALFARVGAFRLRFVFLLAFDFIGFHFRKLV